MLVSVPKFLMTARKAIVESCAGIDVCPTAVDAAATALPAALLTRVVAPFLAESRDSSLQVDLGRASSVAELWPASLDDYDLMVALGDVLVSLARDGLLRIDVHDCEQRWTFHFTQEFANAALDGSALPSREVVPRIRKARRWQHSRGTPSIKEVRQ